MIAAYSLLCGGRELLISLENCESPLTMAYAIAAPAAAPISVPKIVLAALLPSSEVGFCTIYDEAGMTGVGALDAALAVLVSLLLLVLETIDLLSLSGR